MTLAYICKNYSNPLKQHKKSKKKKAKKEEKTITSIAIETNVGFLWIGFITCLSEQFNQYSSIKLFQALLYKRLIKRMHVNEGLIKTRVDVFFSDLGVAHTRFLSEYVDKRLE